MREHERELESIGLQVVIVTFEAGPLAQAYVRKTNLRWPLLVDASRTLYFAYGMKRGRWLDILGPAAWWVYAKLLVRGRRLHRVSGDVRQLGGDVLIDPAGIVRLHHIGTGPAARPPVSAIIDAVRSP